MALQGQPGAAFRAGEAATVFTWDAPTAHAELLIGALPAREPGWPPVDGCVAGVWRVRANRAVRTVNLACRWAPGARWTDVEPDSGQHFDAQTWTSGSTRVTVGTLDGEALELAARRGFAPAHWIDRLEWGAADPHDPVLYERDGFDVILLPLAPGEQFQAHFVVAWTASNPEEIATWFVANKTPEQLARLLAAAV
jgi:hypothetical protein